MFKPEILSDIRDRIPIVAFIGERIPLKKAGRNYRGLCPFHQEKTPSFMVSDEKQIYHCFGCGEGGDIFKFLMKFEGLTFAESVGQLAQRAGVELPKDVFTKGPDEEIARKKKWCYRANQIAAEYFQGLLKGASGGVARNYLKSRGIKDESSTQLFLGYAENGWEALSRHLEGKKVPLELAEELGLIKKRTEEGYYDFFRNRLMFPIISPRGEIIGFSGRSLEVDDKEVAKYLNSPDSLIYHKSNCVYGLNWAADAIRKNDQVILVEGNIDLVSLNQSGIKNVVAPLGTALTSGHIRLLSRYSKNMVLIFDGDEAGSKAAVRALPLFIEAGLTARAVALPKGEDPDSFIRKNSSEMVRKVANEAPTLFEHVIDQVAARATEDTAGRIRAMHEIIPFLKEVGDPVALGVYRGYAAKKLKIKEEIVREALGQRKPKRDNAYEVRASKKEKIEGSASGRAESLLIEILINKPALVSKVVDKIGPDQFRDRSCKTIFQIIFDEHKAGGEINISRLIAGIADPELEIELRQIAMGLDSVEDNDAEQIINDCIGMMEKKTLSDKIEEVNEAIRGAESEGNDTLLFELLKRKRDLTISTTK